MANGSLPAYLAAAKPNPPANRAPWYKNTAQTYAGIFLWIAFYDKLAGSADGPGALGMAGLGVCLLALVAAGLLSHFLFYLVPGLLGMKTGLPLYIVGTSTFGTKGGYFLPGIFMGLLQIGWYSVATFYATKLVLGGFGQDAHDMTLFGPGKQGFDIVFVVLAVVWGYLFAFLGGLGIGMVARMSTYFPVVPIVMLLVAGAMAFGHLKDYDREADVAVFQTMAAAKESAEEAARSAGRSSEEITKAGQDAWNALAQQKATPAIIEPAKIVHKDNKMVTGMQFAGFLLIIQLVIGFFATAGACGADFCSNNRDVRDVRWGGLVGVALATLFAGGLAVLAVQGAHGKLAAGDSTLGDMVNYQFFAAVPVISPGLGKIMLLLFAIGSVAPACFCSFIIGNSLSTMLARPKARVPITMAGATIGILLAALGVAGNLESFFGLIGASFGPVIGAMIADYLLSGKKWAGPREGISIPGYAAWLIGFLVGISNNNVVTALLSREEPLLPGWHPTGLYSLIVGFVVYAVLAKAGLQGKPVPFAGAGGGGAETPAA